MAIRWIRLYSLDMAGSFKDAFRKIGAAPAAPPKPKLETKKWLNELPDDVTFPPPFEAPALLKPTEPPPKPKKNKK